MDFMIRLPATVPDQHDAIMVIVDRLTKGAHFLPTKTNASAEDTSRLFFAACTNGFMACLDQLFPIETQNSRPSFGPG